MAQYIDKSALVAEIERRINNLYPKHGQGIVVTKILKGHYEDLLSFLDSLEMKGEGFKPMDSDFERDAVSFCFDRGLNTTPYIAKTIAKHFFELGLKAREENKYGSK